MKIIMIISGILFLLSLMFVTGIICRISYLYFNLQSSLIPWPIVDKLLLCSLIAIPVFGIISALAASKYDNHLHGIK